MSLGKYKNKLSTKVVIAIAHNLNIGIRMSCVLTSPPCFKDNRKRFSAFYHRIKDFVANSRTFCDQKRASLLFHSVRNLVFIICRGSSISL